MVAIPTRKAKKLVRTLRRKNPVAVETKGGQLVVKKHETSFNPTNDEQEDRTYLITVDGQDTRVREVKEDSEDMAIEYEDQQMAITSKPLLIDGSRFYFTKDGFLGTMALNRDTMLDSDVYIPTKDKYTRYVPVEDVSWDEYEDIDLEDAEKVEREGEEYYKIETTKSGDVGDLIGSKKTIKTMNEAKRLRKLLKTNNTDRQKLLMTLAAGAGAGYMLYPQLQ